MTKEELNQYDSLNLKFNMACEDVARVLSQINPNYGNAEHFYLDNITGDVRVVCTDPSTYDNDYQSFPREFLTLSSKELREEIKKIEGENYALKEVLELVRKNS